MTWRILNLKEGKKVEVDVKKVMDQVKGGGILIRKKIFWKFFEKNFKVEEQEQNNMTTKSPLLRRPTITQQQQKQQQTNARNGCLSGERK